MFGSARTTRSCESGPRRLWPSTRQRRRWGVFFFLELERVNSTTAPRQRSSNTHASGLLTFLGVRLVNTALPLWGLNLNGVSKILKRVIRGAVFFVGTRYFTVFNAQGETIWKGVGLLRICIRWSVLVEYAAKSRDGGSGDRKSWPARLLCEAVFGGYKAWSWPRNAVRQRHVSCPLSCPYLSMLALCNSSACAKRKSWSHLI